jgi:hypothetical protein
MGSIDGYGRPFLRILYDDYDGKMNGVSRGGYSYCIRSPRGAINRRKNLEFSDVFGFHADVEVVTQPH